MGNDFKAGASLDVGSVVDATIPAGAIVIKAGSSLSGASIDTTGLCPCDGRAISRTTYSGLYAVIGTTWGTGDGSTTFNVPNLHSTIEFLSGANANANLNTTAGSSTHTHTLSAEPTSTSSLTDMPHNHVYSANLDSVDLSHGHNQFNTGSWYTGNSNTASQTQYKTDGTQSAAAINHVHSGYVPEGGSGSAVAGYSYAHAHSTGGDLTAAAGANHTHSVAYTTSTSSSTTAYLPYVSVLYYIKL